jgi:hypothetical protein
MIYDENLLGAFLGLNPKSQLLFEVSWKLPTRFSTVAASQV